MTTNMPVLERDDKSQAAPRRQRQLRFVLAFDGSEHAQAAVDMLVDLARQAQRKSGEDVPPLAVSLLSVLPTQHIGAHELLSAAQQHIQAALQGLGVHAAVELKAGNPAATINEFAAECCADLTLVGARGLRATLGILLGGVAQQVVEYSCCPVMVVRAPYHGLRRILVLVDGSRHSREAVAYLLDEAHEIHDPALKPRAYRPRRLPLPQDAEVHVMHVMPPTISPDMALRTWVTTPEAFYPPPAPPIDLAALEKEEEAHGKALLAETVEAMQAGGLHPIPVLLRGDAATEMLQYIKDHHIDLAVCGSRGLSPVQSWLLGSVSRKLVHYADCSVLVVKPQPER